MADRSNQRLNEAIENMIRMWDGTIHGQTIRNMYEIYFVDRFKKIHISLKLFQVVKHIFKREIALHDFFKLQQVFSVRFALTVLVHAA